MDGAGVKVETKACAKCKSEKPKGEFYKNAGLPDGLTSWCKLCTRAGIEKKRLANKLKNELGVDMAGAKFCGKCKSEKPKIEFYKDASSHDGLQAWCKTCCKKISAENTARLDSKSRPLAQKRGEVWSSEDDQFVIMNYGAMPANQMAIELGRTYTSVKSRAYKLRQDGKLVK